MFDWSESSLNHGHDFEDVPPQDVLMKYMTIAVFVEQMSLYLVCASIVFDSFFWRGGVCGWGLWAFCNSL